MAPKGVSSQKPEFATDDSIGQKISDAFLGTLVLVARYISMEWKNRGNRASQKGHSDPEPSLTVSTSIYGI